nr:aminoglycoside phosphotransferase family protein [Acidiferrobacterales bacterium]
MSLDFVDTVLRVTKASNVIATTQIQSLWSGYGQILRLELEGGEHSSVILKHIKFPDCGDHPRGWNSSLSHERKVRSYQVEAHWYQKIAQACDKSCAVPECLAVSNHDNESLLILTDLDTQGFNVRKTSVELKDMYACLTWLANFHATFMNQNACGLWECGTYWHLETRPDELAALDDKALQQAAPMIDQKLRESTHQTLVHGDAKLANFCFRPREDSELSLSVEYENRVAAVDFQYVGRGCGMKDVAYFIGSCLYEEDCERLESELLDFYFSQLRNRLEKKHPNIDVCDL